jgi:hypothetical protein
MLIFWIALAHERLSPPTGTTLSDDEMNEIVHETRIDLSVWLRYGRISDAFDEKC